MGRFGGFFPSVPSFDTLPMCVWRARVCACVRARVCAHVCVCAFVCVRVCAYLYFYVFRYLLAFLKVSLLVLSFSHTMCPSHHVVSLK